MTASDTQALPEKWRPRYLLQRIGQEDMEVSHEEKQQIDKAIASDQGFISVQGNTIKVKMISGIVSKWKNNIPPKPKAILERVGIEDNVVIMTVMNQKELDLWELLFGE